MAGHHVNHPREPCADCGNKAFLLTHCIRGMAAHQDRLNCRQTRCHSAIGSGIATESQAFHTAFESLPSASEQRMNGRASCFCAVMLITYNEEGVMRLPGLIPSKGKSWRHTKAAIRRRIEADPRMLLPTTEREVGRLLKALSERDQRRARRYINRLSSASHVAKVVPQSAMHS